MIRDPGRDGRALSECGGVRGKGKGRKPGAGRENAMKTSKHNPGGRGLGSAGVLVLAACGLLASAGCRDERTDTPPRQFLPDMDDSPKNKPQTEAEFFVDNREMRPRVVGAVAFGSSDHAASASRAWFLKDDPAVFEGVDVSVDPAKNAGIPGYVAMIPAKVFDNVIAEQAERGNTIDRAGAMDWMIQRGHERFNIYCSACHGYNAEGAGKLPDGTEYGGLAGRRWSAPVPSLQDAKYRDRTIKTGQDGYIFNVIQHGVPNADPAQPPKMPSYADKVNVRDAWSVVAYLRVLQASWRPEAGATASAAGAQPGGQQTGNKQASAGGESGGNASEVAR